MYIVQCPPPPVSPSGLAEAGPRIFDPATVLRPGDAPLYLETDTHWRPETMELIAQKLAAVIKGQPADATLQVTNRTIDGNGDIARMLNLPESNRSPAQAVTIHDVASWRPA